MRTLVIVGVGLSLFSLPVSEVGAAGYSKTHQRHAKRYYRNVPSNIDRAPQYPDSSGWYPRDASKLPFGSAIWWEQMLRERRLNQSGP
jgi:hypothetical protein